MKKIKNWTIEEALLALLAVWAIASIVLIILSVIRQEKDKAACISGDMAACAACAMRETGYGVCGQLLTRKTGIGRD